MSVVRRSGGTVLVLLLWSSAAFGAEAVMRTESWPTGAAGFAQCSKRIARMRGRNLLARPGVKVFGPATLAHGTTKMLNFPVGPMNNAAPMTMSGIAGIIELIGGPLLAVGLFTRPVAFILSGLSAIAYFYAHAPNSFFPILNRGELAVIYSFLFLYMAAAGGGPWSIDRLWSKEAD